MDIQALPYVTLLAAIYGSTLIASRFSVGQFDPSTYVGLRLVLASLAHMLVYLFAIRGQKWPTDRQLWKHATLLGIFDTAVPMTLFVSALQYLSSGLASIVATAAPAIIVLLAHFLLEDERLNRRKVVGVTLA